jgi:hypothetical protein
MGTTNDAISWLYSDAANLCSRFVAVHDEIQGFVDGDSRRAALGSELEGLRERIMKRYRVLGVYFPDVSPRLGKLISHDQIVSSEYRRKYLTLEDVLETLLEGQKGKASVADFWHSCLTSGLATFLWKRKGSMLSSTRIPGALSCD